MLNELLDTVGEALGGHGELRTHRVKGGENLSTISQCYYGTPAHALVIYSYNRDKIENPNNVYVGQVLTIPHVPHVRQW